MTRTTYEEQFEEHLRGLIGMGGDPDQVIHLVHCLEGRELTGRSALYTEWLRDQAFACGKCGASFRPESEWTRDTDEVLCRFCKVGFGFAQLGGEPVPGYRQTFARW
jgi:hypothetical protein